MKIRKTVTFILTALLIAAVHFSNVQAQSAAEIEQVTADIAKNPKSPLLASWYVKRGFLHTWNGTFYTKPAVEQSKLSADIDSNRAKALADAESAIKLGERYQAYHLRGVVRTSLRKFDDAKQDFERAAKLKSEYRIVANIFRVDTSGGKIVYPADLQYLDPVAVIFYGSQSGSTGGYETIAAAKDYARKAKQSCVIIRDKRTNKFLLYEAFIADNEPVNIGLAETPFYKALRGRSKLPLTYDALKISPDHSVQRLPKESDIDIYNVYNEIVDIVDAEALSVIKKTNMQMMAGSKGIRLIFDSELEARNYDEAVKIYQWHDKRNTDNNANDLDVVKITRKTNLSKLYRTNDKLKALVEVEMTKWNYSEADKASVRGTKPVPK